MSVVVQTFEESQLQTFDMESGNVAENAVKEQVASLVGRGVMNIAQQAENLLSSKDRAFVDDLIRVLAGVDESQVPEILMRASALLRGGLAIGHA